MDQPVPIRLLKRFVAEYERKGERLGRQPEEEARKVLVIGSGPAGLAAANDLRLLGYGVTLVEALPVLGGMLAVGIPEFRLPRDILQMEIEGIRELGVEMLTKHRFHFDGNGKGFQKLGYDAVFFSAGAHRTQKLNVPGEKLERRFSRSRISARHQPGKGTFRSGRRWLSSEVEMWPSMWPALLFA